MAIAIEDQFFVPQINETRPCTIYLADLVHDHISKGPFIFPLNIGYVAAFTKKYFPDVDIQLFRYPIDLINAVKAKKPDIVGLGNYAWNLELNKSMTEFLKGSGNIVTVLGGPDFPLQNDVRQTYLRDRPGVDFYAVNMGEAGFLNVVSRFMEVDDPRDMKSRVMGNCAFLDAGKELVVGDDKMIVDLEDIPSPYLTGYMDDFFDCNLIPMIETNRGCPYRCSFCAWGNALKDKLSKFSLDRIKGEIDYIFARTRNTPIFEIADANFGIFPRDLEIAEYIKERTGKAYPRFIIMSTAKNSIDRVLKIADVLGDMNNATVTFQSFNQEALNNVNRKNIPLAKLEMAQKHFEEQGLRVFSELILGFPGETRQSHEESIKRLFEYGVGDIACYNLRLLGGTELKEPAYKEKHQLRSKFRLVDGSYGRYDSVEAIESEEMVLANSTMSEEDILYFRPIHWLIQFFWNKQYYKELMHFLMNNEVSPVDFIKAFLERRESAPEKVRSIIDDFHRDSREEWFDSHEELVEHYRRHFDSILKGSFGKLNFKYTYRVLLEAKSDFDRHAVSICRDLLEVDDDVLANIMRYLNCRFVDFSDEFKDRTVEFDYDILQWRRDAFKNPLQDYGRKVSYRFHLDPAHEAALKKYLEQFGQDDLNLTLRKMTEYVKINDLFYKVEKVGEAAPAAGVSAEQRSFNEHVPMDPKANKKPRWSDPLGLDS